MAIANPRRGIPAEARHDADRRPDLMANAQSRPESLNDFLLHQLAEMDIDDKAKVPGLDVPGLDSYREMADSLSTTET